MNHDYPDPSMPRRRGRSIAVAALVVVFLGLGWLGWSSSSPLVSIPAKLATYGLATVVLAALVVAGLRRFIYRVGRRLMFSYFLVGIVPIPLLALLFTLAGYQLNGFFTGHLYRDALVQIEEELEGEALASLQGSPTSRNVATAVYRRGRRVAGDRRLPKRWPQWADDWERSTPPFVAGFDGQPTIFATVGDARSGALVVPEKGLAAELSRRSGILVSLMESGGSFNDGEKRVFLSIGEYSFPIRTARTRFDEKRAAFFGLNNEKKLGFIDRPFLWWGELGGPVHDLATGEYRSAQVAAGLNSTLRTSLDHFFSSSAEIDTSAWVELVAVLVAISALYAIAVFMAATMIFGVSRAVNRLSRATEQVRAGNFSARIPVRRKDQVGDLQRSFNAMASHLEGLVATAAQKESLDKELAVARDLQQSLLPDHVPSADQFEFSTLFEPSAAIGGDFFDIVRLDDNRLAIIVADVAGHGLPTGLRMAMFKAALEILIKDQKPVEDILKQLSGMIRSSKERRYFVTASISIVELDTGKLTVTNAGHPPVYRKRGDRIEEILAPGNALGTLGDTYGQSETDLQPGDFVVWMSDGLIEATDGKGDVFGYERVQRALENPAATAEGLQRNLLSALDEFSGGAVADDDRTLVVMRCRPRSVAAAAN